MILRSARMGAALLGVLFVSAAPEPLDQDLLSRTDCSKCMPRQDKCEFLDAWKAGKWELGEPGKKIAIAFVSQPHIREYLENRTNGIHIGDEDYPATDYRSTALYSFSTIRFVRNDFGASGRTQFAVGYGFPLEHKDQWIGIYLKEKGTYIVAAHPTGLWGHPYLRAACELPSQ